MKTIAGLIDPGMQMDHEFMLPDSLIEFTPIMLKHPNGTYRPSHYPSAVKKDFIDWCEHNLTAFLIFNDLGFKIRVCEEDYVLLKLKYFVKETSWQRTI